MPSARHISLLHPSPTTETHPVTLPSHQPPHKPQPSPPVRRRSRDEDDDDDTRHTQTSQLLYNLGSPVSPSRQTTRHGQGWAKAANSINGSRQDQKKGVGDAYKTKILTLSATPLLPWQPVGGYTSLLCPSAGRCSVSRRRGAAAGWPSPSWKSLYVWVFSGGDIAHIDHLVGTDLEALS